MSGLNARAEAALRLERHIKKAGACAICRERDTQRHHGAAFCRGNFRRQHPTCTHDGRKPRFAPDLKAIQAAGDQRDEI